MAKAMTDIPIREPNKGKNRAQYQRAIDAAIADLATFIEHNPSRAQYIAIRVRWSSKKSGYLVQAGFSDTNTGAWSSINCRWSD